MIIVDEEEWLTVVTQPDHARFAAELLSLWRSDGLPEHPRREDLLFATREHDNGWQEADSAPWIDPNTRRPYDFRSYPEESRLEIWKRGILRFADRRPLVALLIAEHAKALHRPLGDTWLCFFEELEPHRQTWLDRAAIDPSTVSQDYLFLEVADALSLRLCSGQEGHFEYTGGEALIEGDFLRLAPFPLAGTTTFEISIRRIPKQPYDSDTQIGAALARARWLLKRVKVAPSTRSGT